MVCPNCGKKMKWSNFVIDTYPETHHACCDCGCKLDVCEGDVSLCFQAKLMDEQKARVTAILAAKKVLDFEPTGEDQIG